MLQVYGLYNLVPFRWRAIGWAALARQLPKVATVCVVCSFGSTMDITAMQVRFVRSSGELLQQAHWSARCDLCQSSCSSCLRRDCNPRAGCLAVLMSHM